MSLRTRLAAASAIGLVLLGAVRAPGPAAAAATAPCGKADALLAAGRYTDAYAAYAAVRPASMTCARRGMAAAGELQAASQLISVGLAAQADAEIVRAVDADPTLTLPASLLRPAAATQRAIALAESLDAHGFHQQAAQILLSVIEADPGVRLGPAAQAILASPGESFWARLGGFARSWAGVTTAVTLLLLGLSLYPRMRRRLHLQKFTADEVTGVDPEDLRTGVRDELRRLADEHAATPSGRRLRLDIAGPYDQTLDIGPVLDKAPDWLQFIAGLLGIALRRFPRLCRARLVTGNLRAGVVVDMDIQTVDKGDIRSASVKHEDYAFPPASPASAQYAQLALPIAAWIIFERYPEYTLCGTRDLDSFATFAAGRAWQDLGDLGTAERFYQDARDKDKDNTAAAHNLAALWQQDEIAGGAALASPGQDWRALLRTVIDVTRRNTHDPQWFRSRYAFSRGLADLAQDEEQAKRYARELAIEIEEQLKSPGKDTPVEFLASSRGAALALAASQLIPLTEDLDSVSLTGVVPANVTGDDVIRLLRDGGDGAPEILAAFIEANCPEDAEVKYNLYRYQRNRLWACEDAIRAIDREPPAEDGGRRAELEARLAEVKAAAGKARDAMDRYHREISRTGDEAVLARVEAVARAERTREPDGAPDTGEAWLGGAELERAAALNRAELQHQEAQRRQREIKRHAPRIRLGDTDPDGESPLWEDLPG